MPVFEYQCQRCGRIFEKFVLSASADPGTCPACGASDARRKFSTFSSKGQGGSAASTCLPSG
ncbi:MAG: FmdB family zinc ribbon protein [Anaerolineae bacterium]